MILTAAAVLQLKNYYHSAADAVVAVDLTACRAVARP